MILRNRLSNIKTVGAPSPTNSSDEVSIEMGPIGHGPARQKANHIAENAFLRQN